MVEAAMVIPILILVCLSLILVMVHFYEAHQKQMALHKELLESSHKRDVVFYIEKRSQMNQTALEGIVNHILVIEKQHRIYCLKPSQWIRLGEMAGLEDG